MRARAAAWLGARVPAAPLPLADRLARVLAAAPEEVVARTATMSELMAELGIETLGAPTGADPRSPDAALDLLAADAFVTYAFEAAVEEGVEVGPLVDRILARVGGS